ncbi:MAG: aminotransferase class III-fold pyridoxal phosphate-dependent enzyme, partial [Bacteroidota bacterium]
DFYSAIGPISLGYGYDVVDQAVRDQLDKGMTFSLMHHLEYEVCQLLHEIIPNAESIRISKSGADVCTAAVRIARAHTRRERILCCGYHGWHDWYIGTSTRDAGIPEATKGLTQKIAYNNLEDLQSKLTPDTAALILEPFVFDAPDEGYLQRVHELCKANGTLLIFDEMWTGFKIALGGAQEYFGVTPDLAVYSKAVANGMPVAYLTGRAEVMKHFEDDVFFFTTFGGEALSLAATIATIQEMKKVNFAQRLDEIGTLLKDGLNKLIGAHGLTDHLHCNGYPCRTILNLSGIDNPLEMYAFIQQEMVRCGLLWSKFHNITYAFTEEDIAYTLEVYDHVLPLVKARIEAGDVADHLRGQPFDVVFRKTKF